MPAAYFVGVFRVTVLESHLQNVKSLPGSACEPRQLGPDLLSVSAGLDSMAFFGIRAGVVCQVASKPLALFRDQNSSPK